MVKTETISKHELVMIIDAKLTADAKESIVKEITDVITKAGSKVINSQVWFEKHKFTFPIKKRNEGTYYLINFEGEKSEVEKIISNLRLNENVLRYAVINVE